MEEAVYCFSPQGDSLIKSLFFFGVVVVRKLGEKEDGTKLPFASAQGEDETFPQPFIACLFPLLLILPSPGSGAPEHQKEIVCLEAGI